LIAQSLLIKLKSTAKTRSRPREQMWFGRTPIAVLARHIDGEYTEKNMHINYMEQDDPTAFEANAHSQQGMCKVVGFLTAAREAVAKTSEKAGVLVSMGKAQAIRIFEVKEKIGALPEDLVERPWTKMDYLE